MGASVTLRDVARAAGVSTASASRAIARPESVSDELRTRILAAAGRLGYAPNLAARALVARRTGLIGMLVDAPIEPLCAAAVAAFDLALRGAGYSLVIATSRSGIEDQVARGRETLARGVEALVCWTSGDAAGLEEHAAAQLTPLIVFDRPVRTAAAVAVSSGVSGGAQLACRYLLSLGHRRFGTIAAASGDIAEAVQAILAGSRATAFEARVLADGADLDGAQNAAAELLDAGTTAIICGSDVLALAAMRECALRGVSVPGAVSLVGFGDSPPARCAAPPLTSVRVSADEIAARTADALLAMLGGGTPDSVEVSAKLVIRESTGQAP